ncbi:MAG TPA: alkaline phosphatase family protein [Actinomycetota bacterium]
MPRNRTLVAMLGSLLLAAACSSGGEPDGGKASATPSRQSPSPEVSISPAPTSRFERIACNLPEEFLVRIYNGWDEERNGEIQMLPRRPNFMGAGLPHAGPWDFLQDVPMFWYGPGQVPALGSVRGKVTAADIAPTMGKLVGFDFDAPDGEPLPEVLSEPGAAPPRLVVLLIWDGAGRNVLAEWADDWPNLQRLRSQGIWYEDATVDSSPSSSAQIHATFGTGAFPHNHKVTGHYLRIDGEIVKAWRTGPDILELPTLADAYDKALGNEPVVGAIGTVAIQLGMLGHGAQLRGGDEDLAVLRELGGTDAGVGAEGSTWALPSHLKDIYDFPGYVNDLPPLETYFPEVDRLDGAADGTWRGHSFDEDNILQGFTSPARVPFQTRLIDEVLKREPFGRDAVSDLLFINFKLIDEIGHRFTLNNPEMKDSIRAQDRYLPVLIDLLNERVGEGQWVLALTSDHGSTPDPDVSGAFRISQSAVQSGLQGTFDLDDDETRVVELTKQTEAFINMEELEQHGFTLEQISAYLMGLKQQDTAIAGEPVPDPNQPIFQAAFPSAIMNDLPCLEAALAEDG